jgi:hypothetical protein
MLTTYTIDPLNDERWVRFLDEHPEASIFHTREWLQALKRTYGYDPVAFTTSSPGSGLQDAIVCCRVRSWVTGSRMVSLPFSDHCQPLVDSSEIFRLLLSALQERTRGGGWKYMELRPLALENSMLDGSVQLSKSEEFYFHRLNLQPDATSLFQGFHKSCVQRKIRRAERENLFYESGRSLTLLDKFYRLLILTRRRHQLPPQPFVWFRNLVDCLGDRLTIRLVSKNEEPIASMITLAYKASLTYKYGCSDERFHNLGGMPFLFWNAIQEAKEAGQQELDFGRSEMENEGLVQFKDHFGACCSRLTYYRNPPEPRHSQFWQLGTRAARHVISRVPDSILVPAGKLLYRHLG